METGSSSVLPGVGAEAAAATLARLREQRWRLGVVQGDVESAGRRLAAQEVGSGWRSSAQRAYQDRLAELTEKLQGVWRALDDALYAVDDAIDRVKAGL
jgi:uncharacterized protein YukE